MTRRSNYDIINVLEYHILLEDLGPWDIYLTITNNIENVLIEIKEHLKDLPTLSYVSSDDVLTNVNYYYNITTDEIKFLNFY